MKAKQIIKILKDLGDPKIASHSKRFFKTGKGEYGEGDKFLGIRVPVIREQVRKFREIESDEVQVLLGSPEHEARLFALLVLVEKFKRGDAETRSLIYSVYLKNIQYINNWDLVDSSAHLIVGVFLEERDKKILYDLAVSRDLWERRISIMSTFHFIKINKYKEALEISKILRDDSEDLIHKAVGWMLREIGNRDPAVERKFLKQHYKKMPRTMLRYAIEKFPEGERKKYLKGLV